MCWRFQLTSSMPISYRWSSRLGSSSSAHTRATIRPTVSQSIRSIRLIVDLSVRVASHATRHSKSRVNSDPGRANGTLSVRAPCTGHHSRRRRQWISNRQMPRSRCRGARVLRPRVLPRPRRVRALRAGQQTATQRHINNHPVGLKLNLPDPDTPQTQELGKCRRDAHAVPPCKPLTFKQPAARIRGRRRVANQRATSAEFLSRGSFLLGSGIAPSPCPHRCQEPREKAATGRLVARVDP